MTLSHRRKLRSSDFLQSFLCPKLIEATQAQTIIGIFETENKSFAAIKKQAADNFSIKRLKMTKKLFYPFCVNHSDQILINTEVFIFIRQFFKV